MLKYSFMSKYSNCSKDEILDLVKITNKPCKYTYGFKYRNPTTYEVPISREEAIKTITNDIVIDVTEREDFIDINGYSEMDMW